MKKVINGRLYDTDTATFLAELESGHLPNDFQYWREELYVKRTGEYFLYCKGGANSQYGEWVGNSGKGSSCIIPITQKRAMEWAEKLSGDDYERIFGEVEEPDEEEEGQLQRFTVLISESMLEKLKQKKEGTGKTISALIISALKEAGY